MGNPPTAPLSVLEGSVSNMRSLHRNTGRKLFFQKWRAMFIKRLLHSKRYKRALVTQLLMPGFWTLMAMVVAKTFPQPTDSPSRTMNTEMFKKNFVPYSDPNRFVLMILIIYEILHNQVMQYLSTVHEIRSLVFITEYGSNFCMSLLRCIKELENIMFAF